MTSTLQSKENTQQYFNLLNKRTLPREVLKWLQGLDLSYSIKDYRKDLSNGFIFAEVISRYQPGKIPMHAFQNSSNQARRENNWGQLDLFFRKHSVRDVQISQQQYIGIWKSTDQKAQLLYQFICRLYTVCTKRTLPQNTPILDLPPTQANNPNLTASYLLKDDGLQKLPQSPTNPLPQPPKSTHNSQSQAPQDRVPTRKIVPNIDNTSNMVDVTGIGIKADGRKITSKRKSWDAAKEESNYSEDGGDNEKLIFDYLNEMIEECIPTEDPALREILIPQNAKYKPTQSLKRNIASIDSQFFLTFVNQLQLSSAELIPIILRELNETWKFFTYFLHLLRAFPHTSQEFGLLSEMVKQYGVGCREKEGKRIQKVWTERLANVMIGQIKAARQFRKRQIIIGMVYDFVGRDINDKKIALSKLKVLINLSQQILGSSSPLYLQFLSTLISQQISSSGSSSNPSPNPLLEDYIYYAHQYLGSPVNSLRTSALKILYGISRTEAIKDIEKYFVSKADRYMQAQCAPQQVLLLILIYLNLLRDLIASKEYQTLVKGTNATSLVKVYNPDNEKNTQQLKKRANLLGNTIYHLFLSTADATVHEITAKECLQLLNQNKFMMNIFLEYIGTGNKEDILNAEQTQYELKGVRHACRATDVALLQESSNQIIVQLIALREHHNPTSLQSYLPLVNFCLQHLNIKKVNMEIWESISQSLIHPITQMLSNPKQSIPAFQAIKHICTLFFLYDMKIKDLTTWLGEAIVVILQENNGDCVGEVKKFDKLLNDQYWKNRNEGVKGIVEEIADIVDVKYKGVISIKQHHQ